MPPCGKSVTYSSARSYLGCFYSNHTTLIFELPERWGRLCWHFYLFSTYGFILYNHNVQFLDSKQFNWSTFESNLHLSLSSVHTVFSCWLLHCDCFSAFVLLPQHVWCIVDVVVLFVTFVICHISAATYCSKYITDWVHHFNNLEDFMKNE